MSGRVFDIWTWSWVFIETLRRAQGSLETHMWELWHSDGVRLGGCADRWREGHPGQSMELSRIKARAEKQDLARILGTVGCEVAKLGERRSLRAAIGIHCCQQVRQACTKCQVDNWVWQHGGDLLNGQTKFNFINWPVYWKINWIRKSGCIPSLMANKD